MTGPLISRTPPAPRAALVPDEAQARVIAHGEGPLLALGAAGTGKTATIVEAVAARIEAGMAPESVLVLAFGRPAAADLRRRIALRIGGGALPTVATFHGLAHALVRRAVEQDPDAVVPRLLSGAEEDVRVRDLLLGAVTDGTIAWPHDLVAALPTLGLANEVRALLARARDRGVSPDELADAGRRLGHEAWPSIAEFAAMDDEVMALEGVIDYGRLVDLAAAYAASSTIGPALRGSLRAIYVDDAHEADPAQADLLAALTTPATCLVAMADPDLGVYGFRGADRTCVIELLAGLRGPRGRLPVTVVLEQIHRGGGRLRDALSAVRRGDAIGSLPADTLRRYRDPRVPSDLPGDIAVRSFDSTGDLAAHLGRGLRQRYLDGVPWQEMAVLVRTQGQLDPLRRALESAGVPVRVTADDIPLREEPAVAVLLTALEAALHPQSISPAVAVDLACGPLARIDPTGLRALGRDMRRIRRESGAEVPGAHVLLAEALAASVSGEDPWSQCPGGDPAAREALDRLRALGELLARARREALSDALPGEVLWTLWAHNAPSWSDRLRRAALAGHRPSGHDLDAVAALFDAAERASERYSGVVPVPTFVAALAGQRVPAEAVGGRGDGSPGVSLLTAHLARGRTWDHVVIAGAQEGVWPPPQAGASVLRVEQVDALRDASDPFVLARRVALERIAEERRLFALALSRAERSAEVLVVQSLRDAGEQPSRFIDDLGVECVHVPGRPPRPLTLDGLVAELRTFAQSEDASPALRGAAAARLARLADSAEAGEPLVPSADPRAWWGLVEATPGVVPVRPPGEVSLSASALDGLQGCPRRWFLGREARAETTRSSALAFGSLVHVLADAVARGVLPADVDVLEAYADDVWSQVGFDAPWQEIAERAALRDALERFCRYHAASPRSVVATEHEFRVSIPLLDPGDDDHVRVRGAIDRVEIDGDGRVFLVDLKTGRSAPSGPEVEAHTQLAVYQAAALVGALDSVIDGPVEPGGAALVQLRLDAHGSQAGLPRVQEQSALRGIDDAWIVDELAAAVARVRAEDFAALPSQECRTCPYSRSCPAQPQGAEVLP